MKRWFYLLPLLFLACHRDHSQNQLTGAQLDAIKQMTTSYTLAKVYNDSLVAAVDGRIPNADPVMIQRLESMYHHYDSQFETCHNSYEHNTNSADHSHTSPGMIQMHNQGGGMMGSGGMMSSCNCCSNGGHDAAIHDKMTALHQLHSSYHH